MLTWVKCHRRRFESKKEIPTTFSETLSWDYLFMGEENQIDWNIPPKYYTGVKTICNPLKQLMILLSVTGQMLRLWKTGTIGFIPMSK